MSASSPIWWLAWPVMHRTAARLRHVADQKPVPSGLLGVLTKPLDESDQLRVAPIAIARQPHHLPGRARDRQLLGAGHAALGVAADGARRTGERCQSCGRTILSPGCSGRRDWRAAAAAPSRACLAVSYRRYWRSVLRAGVLHGRWASAEPAPRKAAARRARVPERASFHLHDGLRPRRRPVRHRTGATTIRCRESFVLSSYEQVIACAGQRQKPSVPSPHAARPCRRAGCARW